MQIQIRSRGVPLAAGARAQIERQLRLAFGRLGGDGGPITRVRVALAHTKGDVEPGELRCSVLVALGAFAAIEIDEREAHLDVALERAVARAARAVELRLARESFDGASAEAVRVS